MTRLIPLLALCLVLMGQDDCESTPPPEPVGYCTGSTADEGVLDYIGRVYDAIIDGQVATDRLATVRVRFGQSYCSGVVISPHTVLTAGHCGYGTNDHRIQFMDNEGVEHSYQSTGKIVAPEYMGYIAGTEWGDRKADVMILYFDDVELPGPYVRNIYDSGWSARCDKLLAQGWGRTEDNPDACADGSFFCLRETEYTVDTETEKQVITRLSDKTHGKICFGDSGGPIYAYVDVNGNGDADTLMLVGLASTTADSTCLTASAHAKLKYHAKWISGNIR